MARLRDKVTIAHYQETIPNMWNRTMFGDLDWPLNASRGLSAIAEFLVSGSLLDFKNAVTLKSGQQVTQGHRNRHRSIRHLWLPINVPLQPWPISYRFRDKRRFQSKIANFSPRRVFNAAAECFPTGKMVNGALAAVSAHHCYTLARYSIGLGCVTIPARVTTSLCLQRHWGTAVVACEWGS